MRFARQYFTLNTFIDVCPLGYVGGGYGRSLGVRRTGGRQPLHDPEAEGALVLYRPKELSEHEKLKVDYFIFFPLYIYFFLTKSTMLPVWYLLNLDVSLRVPYGGDRYLVIQHILESRP
jgi:hypothetical protein